MSKMSIAYAPDENYVSLTVVSMVSTLDNNPNENIEFIILHSGLSNSAIKKLEWIKSYKKCSIRLVHVNRNEFKEYPTVCWVSTAAWFRTKIAELCPDCQKVLYLDCDTMIRSSLYELFQLDLTNNYVATVNHQCPHYLKLKSNTYFNSGVILINCEKWRTDNLFKKIDEYSKKNRTKIKCADQDVLNIIIDENKINLPEEYNYCEPHFRNINYKYNKLNPIIVHFTGPNPNRFTCINSYKQEWLEYAIKTPCYDEFVNQNIYNIATTYKKHQRNLKRYTMLSKITFGNTKEKYLTKAYTTKLILDSLKY